MKYIFKSNHLICIVIIALCINATLYNNNSPYKLINLYKGTPVLVTGGCGFIGSHLVEKLVSLGADVTILDDLSTGNKQNISQVINNITVIQGTIIDFETCLKATHNKKIIFHTAAFISVPSSTENPYLCNTINVTGTHNLLEAARINNVKRFVFSSTCAIYGESLLPCTENMQPNPTSPYGFSKLLGEIYCAQYSRIFNVETVSLRYFNVYGPRQNPHGQYAGVVAKFMHNMEQNLPITIFGDGTQTRDYIPVERVVEANILCGISQKEYIQGKVFNVATGKTTTLLELANNLKKNYTDYTNEIIFMPPRPGDVKHISADCSSYNILYAHIMESLNS